VGLPPRGEEGGLSICTLLLLFRRVGGYPVVSGGNREEVYGRPSRPPLAWEGEAGIIAPRDEAAGGTWIGVNRSGLFVGISNRTSGRFDLGQRSRGLLCRDALTLQRAEEVRTFLEREVGGRRRYNPFNLLYADGRRAYASSYEEILETKPLSEGLHVLTNGDVDDLSLPRLRRARELMEGKREEALTGRVQEVLKRLEGVLSRHEENPEESLCIHGGAAGTRSSTLLALPEGGVKGGLFCHAEGPPCTAPYEDYSHLLR
jgi:uncharacterized protein with NRDE domain